VTGKRRGSVLARLGGKRVECEGAGNGLKRGGNPCAGRKVADGGEKKWGKERGRRR